MLAGLSDSLKIELDLKGVPVWEIASERDCNAVDEAQFEATVAALEQLGLGDTINQLWKLFASLLHLGNVKFKVTNEGGTWTTDQQHHLESAARLLGLNSNELFQVITVRNFQAGSKSPAVVRPCSSQNECAARRDTLIKLLYRMMFDTVLGSVNQKLQHPNDNGLSTPKYLCNKIQSHLFNSFVYTIVTLINRYIGLVWIRVISIWQQSGAAVYQLRKRKIAVLFHNQLSQRPTSSFG